MVCDVSLKSGCLVVVKYRFLVRENWCAVWVLFDLALERGF